MEFMKTAREAAIPRKRPSDDSNDHEKLRKQKIKVQAVRDFPPGCGIKEEDRKPLKEIRNVNTNFQNNRRTKPSAGLRPTGKVKFLDPIWLKNGSDYKPKVITTVVVTRKPLKALDNVDMNVGKMNSHVNSVNSRSLEHDKLKGIEHAKYRRVMTNNQKPAGKVKFWNPTCAKEGHDPQPKVMTTVVSRGKPLNSSNNVDSNLEKLASNGEDKRFQPKGLGNNKPSFGSKEGEAQKSEVIKTTASQKEHARREKIKEALSVFDQVYTELLQDNRSKKKGVKIAHWRVPVEAVKKVKQMLKWMEPVKSLGSICGVQIGDKFKYRSQLKMIGLHCQLQCGIDYTNIEGKNLAISIVDSHRYSNERTSSDMLIYCGHGGLTFLGPKMPPEDQELKRGNLALKNSMDERTPVRVIRKVEGFQKIELFAYDGLYIVHRYTQTRNEKGKIEFKYHLNRVPGQPPLHQMLNASC